MSLRDFLDYPLPSQLDCIDDKVNKFINYDYDIFELCKEIYTIMLNHIRNHGEVENRNEICNDLKEDIIIVTVRIVFSAIGEDINRFFSNHNQMGLEVCLTIASDWFKNLEDDDKVFIRDEMMNANRSERICGIKLIYQTISVYI